MVMHYYWYGDLDELIVVLALPWNFLDINGILGFPLVVFYWFSGSLWLCVGLNTLEALEHLLLSY